MRPRHTCANLHLRLSPQLEHILNNGIYLQMDTPGYVYIKDFVDTLSPHVLLFHSLKHRAQQCSSVQEFDNDWGCGTAATAADCKSAPSGFIGSSPIIPTSQACIAQSVEHFVGNEEVTSSSLVAGSIWRCSSVGQSARFIPVLSLVRIQSPLPGNYGGFRGNEEAA